MRLHGIQVLRGAAALMVVLHHLRHELAALGLGADALAQLPLWAGVDVFFAISGFIIVHATGPAYEGPGGRRRFLAHRVARVVPLYWLVTLAYLAVALVLPRGLGDA
ncbi:acyltransferase family protein, partial [Methylobacterium hispanicum]